MGFAEILLELQQLNPCALLADGFESALIGIGRQAHQYLAVYDYAKCVELLMDGDGMTHEMASEHMEFNVVGSYVGPNTPIFLQRPSDD